MNLNPYQKTIAGPVTLSGIGVHGGTPASVVFLPAHDNSGIVFHRTDEQGQVHALPAHVSQIGSTDLCTSLGLDAVKIDTVEHLMAAISALEIDNLIIKADGREIPILDGTSALFIKAFDDVGLVTQAEKRRFIRILKPVRVEHGGSWGEFSPYEGRRFEVEIEFDTPLIGRQKFASDMSSDVFRAELSTARTFGFMKDVVRLRAAGLALGASLDNSLVIDDDHSLVNPDGLRFPDEFVRHKVLDAVGDVALAGVPFIGCFRSYRGGHRLNSEAVKALLSDPSAFKIVSF